MKKGVWIGIAALVLVLVIVFGLIGDYSFRSSSNLEGGAGEVILDGLCGQTLESLEGFEEISARQSNNGKEIKERNGEKFTVNPEEIKGGGPGKGGIGIDRGIPALDEGNIKFVSVESADSWIEDNELVLVLQHKGAKCVYPLQIMVWHEIANDVVAGDPIAVTYCPLCGSGIAYYRVIDGGAVKFGTSGKLFNSNLIMYDDLTDTYWQQIDGDAIVGELTGKELLELSVDTVSWRDWKDSSLSWNSEVLSKDTGMLRQYGNDPYGSYYEDSFLIFPVGEEDDRIHPKDVVFGIEVNGEFKAYREEDVRNRKYIEDEIGGQTIRLSDDGLGIVEVVNVDTGEEIVKERDFWFAWYACHPDTELFGFD
jgi:hypothetical protein